MTKRSIMFLTIIIILGLTTVSFAADPIELIVGNEYLDAEVLVKNGRTLVPVRDIFESLGAKVDWEDKTRKVIGVKDDNKIELIIGEKTALVNGKVKRLDIPAEIYNKKAFVPVKFISESLGADVKWMDISRTVLVNSDESAIRPKYDIEKPFNQNDFTRKIYIFKSDKSAEKYLGDLKEFAPYKEDNKVKGSNKIFDKGIIRLITNEKLETTSLSNIKINKKVKLGDYFLRDIVIGDEFTQVLSKFPSSKSVEDLDKLKEEVIIYQKEDKASKYLESNFLKEKGLNYKNIDSDKYLYKGIYYEDKIKQLTYSVRNKTKGKDMYKVIFRFDEDNKLVDIELDI